MAKQQAIHVRFAAGNNRDVNLLINGISGCICDDCARQAYEIVKERTGGKENFFWFEAERSA